LYIAFQISINVIYLILVIYEIAIFKVEFPIGLQYKMYLVLIVSREFRSIGELNSLEFVGIHTYILENLDGLIGSLNISCQITNMLGIVQIVLLGALQITLDV
jgi:hypothetical protein